MIPPAVEPTERLLDHVLGGRAVAEHDHRQADQSHSVRLVEGGDQRSGVGPPVEHAARARELRGRARRDDLAGQQDRDAVADELDLGEQVRVEKHRDASPAELFEQQPDRAAPDRVER